MSDIKATILIIIGIAGDLAVRKLLPAISRLAKAGVLPADFRIIGITRRSDIPLDRLFAQTADATYLRRHIELLTADVTEPGDYQRIASRLREIESDIGRPTQRLFYLSVPPQVSRPIIELLGQSELAKIGDLKLLLEKPFGVDLASAEELNQYIDRYFEPDQVYRIDHYLARETSQNLIVFREHNPLFKHSWNRDFISRIEIIATETIGIEGRAVFYEQTGALRDWVQSHLLQLAALALMEAPPADRLEEVSARRLDALRQLHLPAGAAPTQHVRRGQYQGYQAEVNNPGSQVETFVSLALESDDPRWQGVPIILTAGKAMNQKYTGIKVSYRSVAGQAANQLILRLLPDAGVELCLWAKRPGYDHVITKHPLKFDFQDYYANLPEAYEQVLFHAFRADHSLFTSSDEVRETWRILDPIQRAWEMSGDDLISYRPGARREEILAGAEILL
ncbi:MAG: glucose-6-phosphate dehydrogenase [Patescibacteria group bacterium]